MKVVLDSNVLLAAFATRGLCGAEMTACLNAHQLAISQHILDEIQRNLTGKFKMSAAEARQRVLFLQKHAEVVEPLSVDKDACPDGSDLPVLGTALAAGAECLVTGDQELLSLKEFKGISILAPRAFYDRLR